MKKSRPSEISFLYVPPPTVEAPPAEVVSSELPAIHNPFTVKYKLYFGKRNGIDLEDFSERNFRDDSLEYSLTAYQANRLAETMIEETPLNEFSVFEMRPLIGTTTLALLEHPEITNILASELEFATEFDTNMAAYKYERRVVREDEVQTFNRAGIVDNVALIHLDPGSKDKSQNTDLLLIFTKLMKVAAMIYVPVPAGLKLDLPKIDLEYLKLDNKYNVAFFKNKEVLKNINKARLKVAFQESEKEWKDRLIVFLKKLLPEFGVKEKFLEKNEETGKYYFDEPGMILWMKCFTHKSWDPTQPKFNYEDLEAVGDWIFKGTFGAFVAERVPEIDKEQLTLINQQFMSKFRQPDYSKLFGLSDYLRIRVRTAAAIRKANEDLCEAFANAFYQNANRVEGYGVGFLRIMKMLKVIFADRLKIKFKDEIKKNLNQPKTQVKERMDKVFMRIGMDINASDTGNVATVYIKTREANDFFRSIGILIPENRHIGIAKKGGFNQEEVANLAYIDALANLDRLGFTEERAALESERLRKGDPSLAKYSDQIIAKRTSQGLDAIYFIYDNITHVMKFYGVRGGKYLVHRLIAEVREDDLKKAKARIIENWLTTS